MSVDAALHAARRLTFGPTAELLREMRSQGVTAWFEQQLDYSSIGDLEVEEITAQYIYPALPPAALFQDSDKYKAVDQQRSTVLVHQLMSKRQVFEVMAEFWANHFSIDGANYNALMWRAWDDRNVARKHALGSFPQLLHASSKSPAMLAFLNNNVSSGNNPNENYARELLELHTVGVHGGYNEDDVHQAALALTGWTIDPLVHQFHFDKGRHYIGPLKVMGWRHANGEGSGVEVGESLINYLSTHPATSRHLATKLVRRFVADAPPGGLSSRVAAALRSSGFDIKAALRTIVGSKEFVSSQGGKYRRPAEWLVASMRALGAEPKFTLVPPDVHPALYPLFSLGQAPFGWSPPNGYPDEASAWASTAQTVTRWNLARNLSLNGIGSVNAWKLSTVLPGALPKTAGEYVDRVSTSVLGRTAGIDERAALLELIGKTAGAPVTETDVKKHVVEVVAMLLSGPTMQVR